LTFNPAPENFGLKFKRIDLDGQPVISAVAENVVDTSRGTTIEDKGVRISTIEHVMAALVGMRIDNVLIEINGPETPIADGSSLYFVNALKEAGIIELEAERKYYEIKEKLVYSDPKRGVEIVIFPDDHLSIDVMIDYQSKVLGHQYALINSLDDFETEIAPCRTFVFLHEVEFLLKHNLIKGGDLNNAIVIMDRQVTQEELDRLAELFHKPKIAVKPEGILNNLDIHFSNEPARHKLLDLIGDLALIGTAIKGRIVATRPGHAANTEMSKILRQMIKRDALKGDVPKYDPNKVPLFNVNQIKKFLPHRPPFLLIDKVMSMDEKTIIGIKNVTMNEPFFVGHFPDEPVMPGVLQIESMAQLGGVLVLNTVPDPENYITLFLKIDKVKFRGKVVPGDTLVFKCDLIGDIRRGIATMWSQAFVGDTLVCEGEMTAQIVKNKA
jgi:UDP-3-O-[3-hydroxymyristoyl] N-acetylglucosamine deacetylase/3-hydroxyacyl-[acyl-carrier-protein] dehydratase